MTALVYQLSQIFKTNEYKLVLAYAYIGERSWIVIGAELKNIKFANASVTSNHGPRTIFNTRTISCL